MNETMDLDVYAPAIAAGDRDAFARWIAGAEASVRASLRPLAAEVDTEAVLQESFLRVWQVAPRFVPDGRPNGLARLTVRMARNLALSELRRARPTTRDDEASVAIEVVLPDPFLRRVIRECREALPKKPASALAARLETGGMPDEALAEGLGMRLNTFLQNFTRARKLLAECLERKGVDLGAERR